MPRQERHLRYQLSFETERERIRQEEAALYRKAALELTAPTADTSRFVRKVKEEVFVRCPSDVAAYLANQVYTPFEHFEQEEFWVLLLNTRNRVTHDVMVYRAPSTQSTCASPRFSRRPSATTATASSSPIVIRRAIPPLPRRMCT